MKTMWNYFFSTTVPTPPAPPQLPPRLETLTLGKQLEAISFPEDKIPPEFIDHLTDTLLDHVIVLDQMYLVDKSSLDRFWKNPDKKQINPFTNIPYKHIERDEQLEHQIIRFVNQQKLCYLHKIATTSRPNSTILKNAQEIEIASLKKHQIEEIENDINHLKTRIDIILSNQEQRTAELTKLTKQASRHQQKINDLNAIEQQEKLLLKRLFSRVQSLQEEKEQLQLGNRYNKNHYDVARKIEDCLREQQELGTSEIDQEKLTMLLDQNDLLFKKRPLSLGLFDVPQQIMPITIAPALIEKRPVPHIKMSISGNLD